MISMRTVVPAHPQRLGAGWSRSFSRIAPPMRCGPRGCASLSIGWPRSGCPRRRRRQRRVPVSSRPALRLHLLEVLQQQLLRRRLARSLRVGHRRGAERLSAGCTEQLPHVTQVDLAAAHSRLPGPVGNLGAETYAQHVMTAEVGRASRWGDACCSWACAHIERPSTRICRTSHGAPRRSEGRASRQ